MSDKTRPTRRSISEPAGDPEGVGESEDEAVPSPQVVVRPGTQFFTDPARFYPMVSAPRGLALIINNQTFTQPDVYPTRHGSAADLMCLESLFKQLGFMVVKAQDLSRRDTLVRILDFCDSPAHITADMAVLCISSHGSDSGKIICSDCYELDLEQDILRRFNNQYCPRLQGKPKFFIFQACRGDQLDYGVDMHPHLPQARSGDTDARLVAPAPGSRLSWQPPKELSWEDMLIAYSTLPGYVANRDRTAGTWFVQSLCTIFTERAWDTNLRDMLDLVALHLRDNYTSETGAKQSFNYDVRHFYKKLFFNPGMVVAERDRWRHTPSLVVMEEDRRRTRSGSLSLATRPRAFSAQTSRPRLQARLIDSVMARVQTGQQFSTQARAQTGQEYTTLARDNLHTERPEERRRPSRRTQLTLDCQHLS